MGQYRNLDDNIDLGERRRVTASATLVYDTRDIEDAWNRNEHALAIIMAATTIEGILYNYLLNHEAAGKSSEQRERIAEGMENWSLGRYLQRCQQLTVLEDKNDLLKSRLKPHFIHVRNAIVHERGYARKSKSDTTVLALMKQALNAALEFINEYGEVWLA